MEVEDNSEAELCQLLANVTLDSTSERAVINPSASFGAILRYDDESTLRLISAMGISIHYKRAHSDTW